ncbi:MAG TPA: porin [Bryobacteraceae bacterium]|nr:porin [Bryobacteraceae bacterium]
MQQPKCVLGVLFLWSAFVASGQAPTPPAAVEKPSATDKPPAPAAPVWSAGSIDFSGLVDGYYAFNANHPASQTNNLYNFNVKANQFSLNMAKFSMAHTADPVGFQIDLGFGRTFEMIHGTEQAPSIFRNIEQAFVSLKPAKAKGLQVDFGKFVTNAGAEVIESNSNWNYSRSLLFSWAIPYYHVGVRTSIPVGAHFTGGVSLTNGWNNVEDNNSGKTVGLSATFISKKATWSNNYYTGPEKAGTNKGFRNLYDTTLLLTPSDHANFYVNFDYGRDKNIGKGASTWTGLAAAARFSAGNWAFAPRAEYFSDHDGFSTGTVQKVKEVTLTGEYKMVEGLLARLEFRRDWSDQPFFDRGSGSAVSKNQTTVTLGVLAFFGPKR